MESDREAIAHLINEYAFRVDAGDLEGFAELFARGTWVIEGDESGGDTGYDAVLSTIQNVILYEGVPRTKHLTTNVEIDVAPDGTTASSRCYVTVLQSVPPDFPIQPIFAGHYDDRFAKADGVWHFLERRVHPDLVGDLSRHRADRIA